MRLILDGTVARVRLDRRATSISLLVALGVRADGQKMLLAIKSMGGEGEAAWRALLDDLVRRGLRTPALVVIDGAPGLEKAVAALWPDMAVQRCTVHKHRNLLAHAPERLHEEISNDYRDMIYAATRRAARSRPGARRSSANGASNAAPSPTAWRKPATGCSHSPGSRRANGNRSEPRTRSSDCTRSSSARSTLRPCRPAPKPPPGCSGRCSPQDRSPCARSTDGRPSPRNQTIRSLTSPHDRIASCRPKTRQSIPTEIATGPLRRRHQCPFRLGVAQASSSWISSSAARFATVLVQPTATIRGRADLQNPPRCVRRRPNPLPARDRLSDPAHARSVEG